MNDDRRPAPNVTQSKAPHHVSEDTFVLSHDAEDTIEMSKKERFGDYEIIDEIARGGMGVVYRAKQVNADRIVALKLIRGGNPGATAVSRFQTEACAAAKLAHPNIVPIHDVGLIDGEPFFSMKLIEGESLSQRLAHNPLTSRLAATVVRDVAAGIAHAHETGVVHRDLKPANILIDAEGSPHVTDFGLAKFVNDSEGLTRTGQPLGTPAYMSPEQARGDKETGPPTDIYSLGAVLYSALTGRPPFQAATSAGTIIQVVSKDVVAPRSLNSDIDRDLETICLKCLHKDTNQRYGSAVELREELDRFLKGEPIKARPAGTLERAYKLGRRHPTVAALIAMTLTLVAIIGVAATSAAYSKRLEKSLNESNVAKSEAQLREKETADALEVAEKANARAAITEYYQRIAVAKMAIDDGDLRAAGSALEGLEFPSRNTQPPWELRHLKSVVYSGPVYAIPAFGVSGVKSLQVNEDGSQGVFLDAKTLKEKEIKSRQDSGIGGQYESVVTFFNTQTGQITKKVPLGFETNYAAFSHDLSRMAACRGPMPSLNQWEIQTWDLEREKVVDRLQRPYYLRPDFHPDRQLKYCGIVDDNGASMPFAIQILDLQRQAYIEYPASKDFLSRACRFSEGSNPMIYIVGSVSPKFRTGWLHSYSVPDFQRIAEQELPYIVTEIEIGPSHAYLAGDDTRIHVFDLETLSEQGHSDQTGYQIASMDLNPSGDRLVVGGQLGIVEEFETENMVRTARHFGSGLPVSKVTYANNGNLVLASGQSENVLCWESDSDAARIRIQSTHGSIRSLAFSPSGEFLFAGCEATPYVLKVRVADGEIIQEIGPDESVVNGLKGHPNGIMGLDCLDDDRLITFGWDNLAMIWDTSTGKQLQRITSPDGAKARGARVSTLGDFAVSVGYRSLVYWDLKHAKAQVMKLGYNGWDIAISPDGKLIAPVGGTYEEAFRIFSNEGNFGETDKAKFVLPKINPDGTWSVAFSPDGKLLAFGDVANRVGVINTEDWSLRWETNCSLDVTRGLGFSPDSKRLVAGSNGGRVVLLEADTGRQIMRLSGNEGAVNDTIFSPDGSTIASADDFGNIVLWTVTSR